MAITLDENQQRIVATKKKAPSQRPQYYNANLKKLVSISTDFEAFLILQGRQRNQDTQKWLKQCSDFETRDADRDALAATALKNEVDDASASQRELAPLIRLFQRFKDSFSMTGFEDVVEAGLLLSDVQRAMLEINNLTARLKHRVQYGKIALDALRVNGVTVEDQKQIDSWFTPLTAY